MWAKWTVRPVVCAMFTVPKIHKPDGYDEAIKEVLDAGITFKTRQHVTADRAGTSKPMSTDELHKFLQKRIASYEREIQSINKWLDIQDSADNVAATIEQSTGGLDPISAILIFVM